MEKILAENEQAVLRRDSMISHQEIAIQLGDILIAENVITRDRRVVKTGVVAEGRILLKD